jgi:hypothetical protein
MWLNDALGRFFRRAVLRQRRAWPACEFGIGQPCPLPARYEVQLLAFGETWFCCESSVPAKAYRVVELPYVKDNVRV